MTSYRPSMLQMSSGPDLSSDTAQLMLVKSCWVTSWSSLISSSFWFALAILKDLGFPMPAMTSRLPFSVMTRYSNCKPLRRFCKDIVRHSGWAFPSPSLDSNQWAQWFSCKTVRFSYYNRKPESTHHIFPPDGEFLLYKALFKVLISSCFRRGRRNCFPLILSRKKLILSTAFGAAAFSRWSVNQ